MTDLDKFRSLNQDNWKRTQVRMPQDLYNEVSLYAEENELSLNSAMLVLMDKSLNSPVKQKVKYIFTEWNPLHELEDSSDFISHNDKVRMSCAQYLSEFFTDYPENQLVKFEFKSQKQLINKKEQEILYGIRIWYTYPA